MNKGYDSKEALYELGRLRAAGMDYGANVIFGGAGPGRLKENAEATAEILNRTTPYLIFTGTALPSDARAGQLPVFRTASVQCGKDAGLAP